MSERTGIAWTDSTWNPWRGCRKVSPGCAHCYMYREQTRYGRNPKEVVRSAPATFYAPLKWDGPRRVFTCSWSDFFIEEADDWRAEAWSIIRKTPNLTYQILTKRTERIRSCLPHDWGNGGYPNVWLGTSIEYHRYLYRWGRLLDVPAAKHFVSAEPLLGPLFQENRAFPSLGHGFRLGDGWYDGRMDWVITGGESGPDYRPMEPEWARQVRDFCVRNGIAFFLKQLGGYPDPRAHEKAVLDGRTWTEIPA